MDSSDIIMIQQLLAEYGHVVDDRDWPRFRELFVPDARLDYTKAGASEVFTVGGTVSPFATAFRARSPAATMTVGFDVFVQLVMAAIATEPDEISTERPAASTLTAG